MTQLGENLSQLSAIQIAEQEVRDRESRFSHIIGELRPKDSSFFARRILPSPLGEIEGVQILEVPVLTGDKNEFDKVAEEFTYQNREWVRICSDLPWYGWEPMKRASKFAKQGDVYAFGITDATSNSREIGIYVPREDVETARKKHVDAVLVNHPSVSISLDQLRKLNLSPDFIEAISLPDSTLASELSDRKHKVLVLTDENGSDYSYGSTWNSKVTDVSIFKIQTPARVGLPESLVRKEGDVLDKIRELIGAQGYAETAGDNEGLQADYLFRFNRVLTCEEIAQVLTKLIPDIQERAIGFSLKRFTPDLAGLINIPLEGAVPSEQVQNMMEYSIDLAISIY